MKNTKKELTYTLNEKIRAPFVQLITHDGENLGVTARDVAIRMALEAGLDLVMMSEDGKDGIPVAKIMDLGKNLYEKKKKQHDAKKHQKAIHVKEIKLRPKIDSHDYETKIKQMIKFLKEGKRVKVTLSFRGRENVLKEERGVEIFQRIQDSISTYGLEDTIAQEKDDVAGKLWSRIYYLKKI